MGRLLPSARCALLPLAVWLSLGPVTSQSPFQIDAFDSDENGRLEPIEFVKFLQTTPAKGVKKAQAQQMFKQIDSNNDNGVSQKEFDVFLKEMSSAPTTPPPPESKAKSSSATATVKEMSALRRFYEKHDPTKLSGLNKLVEKRAGKKGWFEEMCAALQNKYGDSPAAYMSAKDGDIHSKANEKAGVDKLKQNRRKALIAFYKKHVPDKTSSDVDAIIAKRESKGDNWFDELCGKLKAKYGEDPRESMSPGTSNSDKPQPKDKSNSKKPEKSSKTNAQQGKKKKRGTVTDEQRSILEYFYAKHAPNKSPKSIEKAISASSASGGDAWFGDFCAALKEKYGEDPRQMEIETDTKPSNTQTDGEDSNAEPDSGKSTNADPSTQKDEPAEEEKSTKQNLLDRLLSAVKDIQDLAFLENDLVKKAEDHQAVEQEKADAAEKEAKAKAEEEAKIKAEKKAAARKRAAEARAAAAEKLKAAEEAEEAALALETFDPVDLDNEDNLVLLEAEVVTWLTENRLSQYTHQIARFGGTLADLRMRVKAADMETMGMTKAETARMKKALKKLRKEAREAAASSSDPESTQDAQQEGEQPKDKADK